MQDKEALALRHSTFCAVFGDAVHSVSHASRSAVQEDSGSCQVHVYNVSLTWQGRGCPLRGLHATPDLQSQCRRFTDNGWARADARDMATVYRCHMDPADRQRCSAGLLLLCLCLPHLEALIDKVRHRDARCRWLCLISARLPDACMIVNGLSRAERLEIFDEFEEWNMIQVRPVNTKVDATRRQVHRSNALACHLAIWDFRRHSCLLVMGTTSASPSQMQEHYCIAVGINDRTGTFAQFGFQQPKPQVVQLPGGKRIVLNQEVRNR